MKTTSLLVLIFLSFVLFIAGCATPMHKRISSVTPSQLEQKGMIAGHMSLHDSKTGAKLGGLFGSNFRAYATRTGANKKVYDVGVENKDDGYFGWPVEPGTYWIHHCRITDPYGETSFGDMTPYVEVKAGEIAYIGHIHYEVGRTHFGKTMKKIFSSEVKDNLKNMGGLLVEVEQQVTNKQDDMKTFLRGIGLGGHTMKAQIVEGWKYMPE